jgi:hypothetical protein
MEDSLGFRDAPFVPVGLGVRSVPEGREPGDLMQRDGFATGQAVTAAPRRDFVSIAEGQDHGAVLEDVIPGAGWGNGEVDDGGFEAGGAAICNRYGYGFAFRAVAGVNVDFAADESRDTERAPDAGSPPAVVFAFDPVDGRR